MARWSRIKEAESRAFGAASAAAGDPRQRALTFLITALWLEDEAAARGIRESAAQAASTYGALLRGADAAGLSNRMRALGLTAADEQRELRLDQLSLRLRASVLAAHANVPAARRQAILAAFVAGFRERWRRVTVCSPGYVVAQCSNGPAPGAGP